MVGVGGEAGEVWFPCLGEERKLVPSFSWGSLLFRAKMGRHPFREEKKRGFLVLWQGVKGRAPLPFIKCEMGSPHVLLWRVIKGPARRVSARGWGPIYPALAEGWGAGFAHSFGGAGEEVAREWIWKS